MMLDMKDIEVTNKSKSDGQRHRNTKIMLKCPNKTNINDGKEEITTVDCSIMAIL